MRKLVQLLGTIVAVSIMLAVSVWASATQPFVSPIDIDIRTSANPATLRAHVVTLSEQLPPRDDDPRNLDVSAEYIFDILTKYGSPEYQEYDVRGITYRNVLLRMEGETAHTIIIGAHYDAYAGFPGADDNASGVAGILELARMFSEQPPSTNVILIAYALEEPPYFQTAHMGSHHHASSMTQLPQRPVLMISLEMIGYFSDEAGSQRYPISWLSSLYSDTGNFIAVVGRWREISSVRRIKGAFFGNTELPTFSLTFLSIIPGMTFSDHKNYWAHDIDAIMITDTAFERNANYHTETDTADTLDYARMAQVVDGTFSAVMILGRDYGGGSTRR